MNEAYGETDWLAAGPTDTADTLGALWKDRLHPSGRRKNLLLAVDGVRAAVAPLPLPTPHLADGRWAGVATSMTRAAAGRRVRTLRVDAVAAGRAARDWLAESLVTLPPGTDLRLAELAVLGPVQVFGWQGMVDMVRGLWRYTAEMTDRETDVLLGRLAESELVGVGDDGVVWVDPVARAAARCDYAPEWFAALNGALVDEAASLVGCDWWEMDVDGAHYLWDHLVGHLVEAGRREAAESLATDLRWMALREVRSGSIAASRDLATAGTAHCAELSAWLAVHRSFHSYDTDRVHLESLLIAVRFHPWWGPQAARLLDAMERPVLVPSLPPSTYRGITGIDQSPDGATIAIAAKGDRWVWLHDAVTWRRIRGVRFAGRSRNVGIVADGTRLVVHRDDWYWLLLFCVWKSSAVQVHDTATGDRYYRRRGRRGRHIRRVHVTADGSHMRADLDFNGSRTVGLFGVGPVTSTWRWVRLPQQAALSPDGDWLAEIDYHTLRLRDVHTGRTGPAVDLGSSWYWVGWLPDGSGLVAATFSTVHHFTLRR